MKTHPPASRFGVLAAGLVKFQLTWALEHMSSISVQQ
jgi:hypothetical protein